MDGVKRIWYLSPMRAAKVQASLRIHAVSPEPPLLAYTSSESRGTFRQKARSLAPLNGWACAVKICHDGMLEDTNSLDGAQISKISKMCCKQFHILHLRSLSLNRFSLNWINGLQNLVQKIIASTRSEKVTSSKQMRKYRVLQCNFKCKILTALPCYFSADVSDVTNALIATDQLFCKCLTRCCLLKCSTCFKSLK